MSELTGRQRAFLKALEQTGLISVAAAAVRCHRRTPYRWLAANPAFAEAVRRARETMAEKLEVEATRRAREGVKRRIYWRGKVVGTYRKPSGPVRRETAYRFPFSNVCGDRAKKIGDCPSGHSATRAIQTTIPH